MIIVGMECGHRCGIDRHKRQADRTLLFEYTNNKHKLYALTICKYTCEVYDSLKTHS